MSEARWDIPETWTWATAGDVARIVGGGTPSSKVDDNFSENGIPWITPADLTGYRGSHISRGRRDLSEKGFSGSGSQVIPAGSVLFSSRAPIGYCVIASNDVTTNQGFKSLVLRGDIIPEYIRHYLIGSKEYAESKASGTTFMELSGARVAELAIPLAPVAEQRRIVAKVDGLIACTGRARAELDRVPVLIARYKQRLLSLAFSGELTAPWREKVRSAPVAHRSPDGIDGRSAARSRIPSDWQWTSFGEVANVTGGLTKNRNRDTVPTRAPYLRVANVYANELRLGDVAEIGCTHAELEKTRLRGGDIMIVEGNGSIDQVGRAAIWNNEIEGCSHQNHIIRARAHPELIPLFGLFWLMSPLGRAAIEGVASSSSGLHTLSISKINGLPIPICSVEEQSEIVRRLEIAFSWLGRVSADHAGASTLLPKLDGAILAKAFRGELVPQDPEDEPARVLLERVRHDKGEPRGRSRRTKTINPKDSLMAETRLQPSERILQDSETWPASGLSVAEVMSRNPLPHDDMRDALFNLLSGPAPRLRQEFDPITETMMIKRVVA